MFHTLINMTGKHHYHLSILYLFLVKFGILVEVRVNVVLLSKICGS